MSLLVNLSILESYDITLQSWACDIFFSLATTTKRRYRAQVTRQKSENIQAAVSKWSSHNENFSVVACPALRQTVYNIF